MSMEDFIINVFCLIDDLFQKTVGEQRLRTRGFPPQLSDSEVITMEIVVEYQGIDTDKGIWQYMREHWKHLFPAIGSRSNFAKHMAYLWHIKQQIQQTCVKDKGGFCEPLHMADGFPIPVCRFKRAKSSCLFKGVATYGYCASKDETYYGFKGNVLIDSEGMITDITITPANVDERTSLWDIVKQVTGLVIADKGLLGADIQEQMRLWADVDLQTPVRLNMKDNRRKAFTDWLVSTRRLVETVIGQLSERFHIEKIWARNIWHLTNRIARKVLAYTICILINKQRDNNPLQFECLVHP